MKIKVRTTCTATLEETWEIEFVGELSPTAVRNGLVGDLQDVIDSGEAQFISERGYDEGQRTIKKVIFE